MGKILLIIQREYLTRVRKRAFLIMTIVGPIIMASLMIVPIWLSMRDQKGLQLVQVIDESYLFKDSISSNKNLQFEYADYSLDKAQDLFLKSSYAAILYIPSNILSGGATIKLFYKEQLGIAAEEHIKGVIEEMIYNFKLQKSNVDLKTIQQAHTTVNLITEKINENGSIQQTSTNTQMAVGMALGFLIYFFIFLFGAQVMRGVIEEKSSRIIEVIISSVKPFQLMMGKIIGVAMVGLTQFLLWLLLTGVLYTTAETVLFDGVKKEMTKKAEVKEIIYKKGANLDALKADEPARYNNSVYDVFHTFSSIDFRSIILCFLVYFLGGYMLYGALFAAIGAAVDAESDTQQFMLPLTMPLVLSFVMAQTIIQSPDSNLAFWFSIIPLTSPVIMMVRLPFGVPAWQLILSMSVLVASFIVATLFAARIYRTGILMYGKKASYKELWKWLFYT